MVENVAADLKEYLAWNGSLNASFETLGAYHFWAQQSGRTDAIYEAAEHCPPLRRAIRAFIPTNKSLLGRSINVRKARRSARGIALLVEIAQLRPAIAHPDRDIVSAHRGYFAVRSDFISFHRRTAGLRSLRCCYSRGRERKIMPGEFLWLAIGARGKRE
jgi:hypothetical protein